MVYMIFPSSFVLVLIPPVFPLRFLGLFPQDHLPHLAQAPQLLAAGVKGDQDRHFVSLEYVSYQC